MPANAVPAGNHEGYPPRPPFPWQGWLAAVVVFGVLWWSAVGTGVNLRTLAGGWTEIVSFFHRLLPSAEHPWPLDYLPQILVRLLETIKMATAGAIIGSALALWFCLGGARNLAAGKIVYNISRALLNLIRTVPDLILATLFATILGIGPLPGVVALIVLAFGLVAKLLADTLETIDPGPLEAITAAGGSNLERAIFAALPQVLPDFLAYTLYAFEVNVRSASVLGLVGAGGIGMILQRDLAFMDYSRVGLIIATIFVTVLLIDGLSTFVRRRLV